MKKSVVRWRRLRFHSPGAYKQVFKGMIFPSKFLRCFLFTKIAKNISSLDKGHQNLKIEITYVLIICKSVIRIIII